MLNDNETTNLDVLMQRIRDDRCQNSFRKVFDDLYPKVVSYLKQGGAEPQKASEMAQEVLLTIWHKSHLFDSTKGSLTTWVFTIARNIRFDHFRGSKDEALQVSAEDIFESIQDSSAHLDFDIESSEIRAQVELLPPEQRDAIQAMYFQGHSHSEYSEMKGIPVGTVKSRIRLAFAQLKRALEEK